MAEEPKETQVEIKSPDVETIVTPAPTQKKMLSKKTIIFIIAAIVLILIIAGFAYYKLTGNTIMAAKNPQVLIKTSAGDITLELYPDKAPITVPNFLKYVNDGAYDGTVFHRVIKGFMIQGGGFTPDGAEKSTKYPAIKLESNNGLANLAGTIAMARTNVPDSATNQFFINTVDNDFLNYRAGNPGYAVFGKVISGMDVVKKIEQSKTTSKKGMDDWPVEDITIISVKQI